MEVSGRKKNKLADVLCDVCLLLGKNMKAEHFCADCNDYFCENCCMVHKVTRYTRNHKFLDSGNMPKQKLESHGDSVCSKHSRKGLEYICEDHNSIFCSVCVTLDHKNCNLLFIDDIATDFDKTPQYKTLIDSIASLTKQLQEMKDMSIKKGEKLQKSHGKFIRDVKAFRKEINQILDTIEGTIIKEADDLKEDHLKLAVSDTAMCDNMLAELNIASEKMREQLRYMQHRQLVISVKETQIKGKEYDAKLVKMAQGESMELEFVRNENLLQSLRSFKTMGVIKKPTAIKLGISTLKQSFPDNRGLQSFNKEIEDYKKQSAEQLAAKQLVDEQLGAAKTERKKLERAYHNLQDEAEELRRQLKIRDTELQQTKVRELQSFNKEIEDYKKQSAEQLAAKQLVDEQLGAAKTERKKLERVYHKLQDEAEELRRQLKIRDTELQQTKVRLSEIMDNPDIVDFSDPNRPTKLAEKFAELYDNDWTDAFEEIQKLRHYDEVKCVDLLLQILMISESFCTRKWREYVEGCKRSLQKGKAMEVPDIVAKQLKDITKSFAPNLVDDVYKEFKDSSAAWLARSEKLQPYLKGCIELCWLMVAQDPPVVFKTGLRRGEIIDKAVLREYTRSGDRLEYLVWPPLLLHEGGPLLAKGVAQAVEDARRPQSAPSGERKDTSTRSGASGMARSQVDRNRKTAWGDTNDDPIVTTPPSPMSVDVCAPQHAAPGNYQQSSVRTNYSDQQYPSDGHQQQSTGNQQPTHGTSPDGQRMVIGGGQTYTPHQQVDSSGRPIQQSQQPLPRPVRWNHSSTPTPAEMDTFMDYVYRYKYSEELTRHVLGNERYEMCRDYVILQERLMFPDGYIK